MNTFTQACLDGDLETATSLLPSNITHIDAGLRSAGIGVRPTIVKFLLDNGASDAGATTALFELIETYTYQSFCYSNEGREMVIAPFRETLELLITKRVKIFNLFRWACIFDSKLLIIRLLEKASTHELMRGLPLITDKDFAISLVSRGAEIVYFSNIQFDKNDIEYLIKTGWKGSDYGYISTQYDCKLIMNTTIHTLDSILPRDIYNIIVHY